MCASLAFQERRIAGRAPGYDADGMDVAVSKRSREHGLVLLIALALPAALFAVTRLLLHPDPRGWGTHEQLGFKPCFPMAHWNVPCPGCGVTTALALLARGDLLAALRTQPFGLVVATTALGGAFWALSGHVRGRDLAGELAQVAWKRWGRVLATLAVLAWLYKLAVVRMGP